MLIVHILSEGKSQMLAGFSGLFGQDKRGFKDTRFQD